MSNRLEPRSAPGARRKAKRVGRGTGSNRGSTCGRGDKGQNSRSGGGVGPAFEGGQMPLHRRLPKRGFNSMNPNAVAEVRLSELARFAGKTVDIEALKKQRIIPRGAQRAKVINSGALTEKVDLRGILATPSARAVIEAAQGTVED